MSIGKLFLFSASLFKALGLLRGVRHIIFGQCSDVLMRKKKKGMSNTHMLGVDTHFNSFVMIAMIGVKTRLWLGNGMNSIDKSINDCYYL